MKRLSILLLLTLFAAPAGAATIGPSLDGPTQIQGCPVTTTCTTTLITIAGEPARAPFDGVLTSWALRTNGAQAAPVQFKVLRPASGNYSLVTTQPPSAIAAGGTIIHRFQVRIAVRANDAIAIDRPTGLNNIFRSDIGGGEFDPPIMAGQSRMPTAEFIPLLQANVERDRDGDGFGDETQDNCPTDSTTQGACPPPAAATVLAPSAAGLTTAPADGTAPAASVSFPKAKLKDALSKGLVANVTVNEAASLEGAATVPLKRFTARVNAEVAAGSARAAGAGTSKLTLKFDSSAKRTLRRLKKLSLTVRVTATDRAGNRTTARKALVLKP